MNLFSLLLAAALAASAPAAAPEPAAGAEALAETLLSVLPDRGGIERVGSPDPEELVFLTGLNPGKEPQVKAALEGFETCIAPATADGVRRMVRKAAATVGAAKVRRMIEFYRLDDKTMRGLIERLGRPAPSAADLAEMARLRAAYPLDEYHQAFERAKDEAAAGGDLVFMAEVVRCGDARKAAFARAGLKTQ